MNTNRNNNRRRGRGNNRGPGGGNQGNRIDSRARGNAPQLLEKYRKLAHDASLNDDRVQTEYYLQFADHYFRVLADSRVQKEEARPRREFDREQPFDDEDEESGFEEARAEQSADQRRGRPREESGADEAASERAPEPRRGRGRANGELDESKRERPSAPRRGGDRDEVPAEEGSPGVEGDDESSEDVNPFTRDTPARGRRPRTRGKLVSQRAEAEEEPAGVDPAVLPPAISRSDEESREERPTRARAPARTRARRTPPADAGDAETFEAVS